MILRCTALVLSLILTTQSASIKSPNNRVCPDGKTTPLYEGEYNIFPCVYECPSGFSCELQDSPQGGICCPDYDLLYELYSDDHPKEATTKQLVSQSDQLDDVFDLPNIPNVPVVIVDDKESNKSEIEQNLTNSVEVKPAEIRRSPTLQPTTLETTTQETTSLETTTIPSTTTQTTTATTTTTTKKFSIVTLSATRSQSTTLVPTKSPIINQAKKTVALTCRRQQLAHKCFLITGRQVNTQYVVRWYKQNGACHSYIYGYCPGTRIDIDLTLRTKDDCEALCLSADEFQQSDLFKFLTTNSNDKNEFSAKSHAAPLIESAETIALLNDDKSPSLDLVTFQSSRDSPIQTEDHIIHVEASTIAPQKRCNRLPYRSVCPDSNLPSQFTIRWHNKNGVCVAYGFGYCHGEVENETLKSKEQCERYCIRPSLTPVSSENFDFSTRLIR